MKIIKILIDILLKILKGVLNMIEKTIQIPAEILKAENITYDNEKSDLDAGTLQGAIDELQPVRVGSGELVNIHPSLAGKAQVVGLVKNVYDMSNYNGVTTGSDVMSYSVMNGILTVTFKETFSTTEWHVGEVTGYHKDINYYPINGGKKYTISLKADNITNINQMKIYVAWIGSDNQFISYSYKTNTTNGEYVFISPENAKKMFIRFGSALSNVVDTSEPVIIYDVMVCDGDKSHPYVPYSGYNVNVTKENIFGGEAFAKLCVEKGLPYDESTGYLKATGNKTSGIVIFDNFKPNTQYTIIEKSSEISQGPPSMGNIRFKYTDDTTEIENRPYIGTGGEDVTIAYVSNGLKSVKEVFFTNNTGSISMQYDLNHFGIFEGVLTVDDFKPYYEETYPITSSTTEPLYIDTYEGETNIIAPTTVNVRYGANAEGVDLLNSAYNGDNIDRLLTDSVTDDFVHLDGTFEGVAKVSGFVKNLLPFPYSRGTETINGIPFTVNADGTVTLGPGTATARTTYILRNHTNNTGEVEQIISGCPAGVSDKCQILVAYYDENPTWKKEEREIGTGRKINNSYPINIIAINVEAGAVISSPITFKPMLETIPDGADESEYPHDYVPYAGYEVKSVGKNLVPFPYAETTKESRGITFTDNGDGSVTLNGTATEIAYFTFARNLKILKGSTFRFSGLVAYSDDCKIRSQFINPTSITNTITRTEAEHTFENASTFISDDDKMIFRIQIPSGSVLNNVTLKPQIEYGTITTAYEPYTETTTTVTQETEELYLPTYDGQTNIFTDYGVPLDVEYGLTDVGAQVFMTKMLEERYDMDIPALMERLDEQERAMTGYVKTINGSTFSPHYDRLEFFNGAGSRVWSTSFPQAPGVRILDPKYDYLDILELFGDYDNIVVYIPATDANFKTINPDFNDGLIRLNENMMEALADPESGNFLYIEGRFHDLPNLTSECSRALPNCWYEIFVTIVTGSGGNGSKYYAEVADYGDEISHDGYWKQVF